MVCVKLSKCFNTFVNCRSTFIRGCLGIFGVLSLSACVSGIWTGAGLIYDRHSWYLKFNDFKLGADSNRALYRDDYFKCDECTLDIAVFNQDVLLTGHVPSKTMHHEATARMNAVPGKRRFFDELAVYRGKDDPVLDSWITTKIRSEILADVSIDPDRFKIVTADQVVFLMGDVDAEQAKKVVIIARECNEVRRVVKLMRYYQLANNESDTSAK
jgi:osmotically-inducible protein OsmY